MNETRHTSWHTAVAEQLQITMSGATAEGTNDPSDWNGTYLVRLEERAPERCVWGSELPEECGWQRLEVEVIRGADLELLVSVTLRGILPGPAWSGLVPQLQGVQDLQWSATGSTVIGGVAWPERIRLRSLAGLELPHGFFLAPEPEENELEAVVAVTIGCDPKGDDYKRCHPMFKGVCCLPDTCGCTPPNPKRCGCGYKEVSPFQVPAANVGICSGCTTWDCPKS